MKHGIWTLLAAALAVSEVRADVIVHGAHTINMDFVPIYHFDNANVSEQTFDRAQVHYRYRIGQYEVTIEQFMAARAADDRISNGNENYWSSGMHRIGEERIRLKAQAPATLVSWLEAARFCNWLTTGNAYEGAYQFDNNGVLIGEMNRNQILQAGGRWYVLPTESEWRKAAHFKADGSGYTDYATGESPPSTTEANYRNRLQHPWLVGTGAEENNGTFDMDGNVWEWTTGKENLLDGLTGKRINLGGDWASHAVTETGIRDHEVDFESSRLGFRVVAIPEPSSALLAVFSALLALLRRTRLIPKLGHHRGQTFFAQYECDDLKRDSWKRARPAGAHAHLLLRQRPSSFGRAGTTPFG